MTDNYYESPPQESLRQNREDRPPAPSRMQSVAVNFVICLYYLLGGGGPVLFAFLCLLGVRGEYAGQLALLASVPLVVCVWTLWVAFCMTMHYPWAKWPAFIPSVALLGVGIWICSLCGHDASQTSSVIPLVIGIASFISGFASLSVISVFFTKEYCAYKQSRKRKSIAKNHNLRQTPEITHDDSSKISDLSETFTLPVSCIFWFLIALGAIGILFYAGSYVQLLRPAPETTDAFSGSGFRFVALAASFAGSVVSAVLIVAGRRMFRRDLKARMLVLVCLHTGLALGITLAVTANVLGATAALACLVGIALVRVFYTKEYCANSPLPESPQQMRRPESPAGTKE